MLWNGAVSNRERKTMLLLRDGGSVGAKGSPLPSKMPCVSPWLCCVVLFGVVEWSVGVD